MRFQVTVTAAIATLFCSIGLYPLFDSGGWFWYGFGGILAVSAAGLLVRRFRLPAIVNLLAGLAALFLYLTMAFTGETAYYGVIPGPDSLAQMNDLANEGGRTANKYAAPVPAVAGVKFLAAAGIGLVAVIVDLLAVRLRRAAPAGLPLLAMYSVPAAVRDEAVSWAAFLLGASGFLAMLLMDAREQVTGWGRPVFTRRWSNGAPTERPSSAGMAVTGRRIGLTAVAIAVVVPMAVPGLQAKGMFGAGGEGKGNGSGGTITTPEPLVNLKRQLTHSTNQMMLTYETSDSAPTPDYLRMYSLDRFNGDTWTYTKLRSRKQDRVSREKVLPKAQGLETAESVTVRTKVKVAKNLRGMNFLATPYPPVRVQIGGNWRADPSTLMLFSPDETAGGRSYTVESTRVNSSPQQLRHAPDAPVDVKERYLEMPGDIPARVRQLALKITRSRPTQYGKAMALQDWFTKESRFTYSLEVQPPKDIRALEDFLFESRTGYCEQFAASMALLARYAGIPARVAVGFTAGSRDDAGNRWTVRAKDTHAWPELYFHGAGWMRFEPTPAGGTGQGTASTPGYASRNSGDDDPDPSTSPNPEPTTETPGATAAPTPGRPNRADSDDGAAGDLDKNSSDLPIPLGWLLALAAAAVLAVAPFLTRRLSRWRRWARARDPYSTARAAWAELRADVIDHGFAWRHNESPRMVSERLGTKLNPGGEPAAALSRICHAEEQARYARSPVLAPARVLRADSRTVRRSLAAAAGYRARWRGHLVPPSALADFRQAGIRVLEAFDWLDVLGTRNRKRRKVSRA